MLSELEFQVLDFSLQLNDLAFFLIQEDRIVERAFAFFSESGHVDLSSHESLNFGLHEQESFSDIVSVHYSRLNIRGLKLPSHQKDCVSDALEGIDLSVSAQYDIALNRGPFKTRLPH